MDEPRRYKVVLMIDESYRGQYDGDSLATDVQNALEGLELEVISAEGKAVSG